MTSPKASMAGCRTVSIARSGPSLRLPSAPPGPPRRRGEADVDRHRDRSRPMPAQSGSRSRSPSVPPDAWSPAAGGSDRFPPFHHLRDDAEGVYDNFTVAAGARLTRNDPCCADRPARRLPHERRADGRRRPACGHHHIAHPRRIAPAARLQDGTHRRSRGVFQGKILRRKARSDGYQMNQALLLSEDAETTASRSWKSTPTT